MPPQQSPLSPHAAAAASSASSSATPAAAAVVSDAGAPFVLATDGGADADAKPSAWRRNVALLALAGALAYHAYSEHEARLAELNRDVVSCIPGEIHDLINVFHFTTKDMQAVYKKTMQRSEEQRSGDS